MLSCRGFSRPFGGESAIGLHKASNLRSAPAMTMSCDWTKKGCLPVGTQMSDYLGVCIHYSSLSSGDTPECSFSALFHDKDASSGEEAAGDRGEQRVPPL